MANQKIECLEYERDDNEVFLVVDYRERKMIEYLNEKHEELSYDISNLYVGDIMICRREKDTSGNDVDNILAIIERKTIPDLLSSLKDGRYRSQVEKMLAQGDCFKEFMIEKDDSRPQLLISSKSRNKLSDVDRRRILGVECSVKTRGISVRYVSSMSEGVDYVLVLFRKYVELCNGRVINKNVMQRVVGKSALFRFLSVVEGIGSVGIRKLCEIASSVRELRELYEIGDEMCGYRKKLQEYLE